jgi:hypothetical protein
MGSLRIDGVRFFAYLEDHEPCHLHAFYAQTEAIVELRRESRQVALAARRDAVRPGGARRSDVKHILQVAAEDFDVLCKLWEDAHD